MPRRRPRSVDSDATLPEFEHPSSNDGATASHASNYNLNNGPEIPGSAVQDPSNESSRIRNTRDHPTSSTPVPTNVQTAADNLASHTTGRNGVRIGSTGSTPSPRRPRARPRRSNQEIHPNNNAHWTYEENVTLIRLRDAGVPYAELGRRLGRTDQALRLNVHYIRRGALWCAEWHQLQHERGATWASKNITDEERRGCRELMIQLGIPVPTISPKRGARDSGDDDGNQSSPPARKRQRRTRGTGRARHSPQAGPSSRATRRRGSPSRAEPALQSPPSATRVRGDNGAASLRRPSTTGDGVAAEGPPSQQILRPQPLTHGIPTAGMQAPRTPSAELMHTDPPSGRSLQDLSEACERARLPSVSAIGALHYRADAARDQHTATHQDGYFGAAGRAELIYSPTARNGTVHAGRYTGPPSSPVVTHHRGSATHHRNESWSTIATSDDDMNPSPTHVSYRRLSSWNETSHRVPSLLSNPMHDPERSEVGRFRSLFRWSQPDRLPTPRPQEPSPQLRSGFQPDVSDVDRNQMDRVNSCISFDSADSGYRSLSRSSIGSILGNNY